MIIIGEKINGTRKAVGEAIRKRDTAFIMDLAEKQTKAGSSYLDINAGTSPEREPDDMAWLVDTVQSAVETPLCLDSANPEALKAALKLVKKTPIINSVSGEAPRINGVLPLAVQNKTSLILLALDHEVGIPNTSDGRMEIVRRLVNLAKEGGLTENMLYIDPLVTAISTGDKNALVTFETIKKISEEFPEAHITCGLSNISFGMPMRSSINRTFVAMCVQMGLDSAIIDPNDSNLMTSVLSAEMLMGKDKFCQKFSRAYRSGLIGNKNN